MILFAPFFCHAEGLVPGGMCDDILSAPAKAILKSYQSFHDDFARTGVSHALDNLTGVLNADDFTSDEKFAAMVAFLDRNESTYSRLVEDLPALRVRVVRRPWIQSLRNTDHRTIVLGNYKYLSRVRAVQELLSLASVLSVLPTQSTLWTRDRFLRKRNGFCSALTCVPWQFASQTLAKLKAADARITTTFDFLRLLNPNIVLPAMDSGPTKVLTLKELLPGLFALAIPVGIQYEIFRQVPFFVEPAIVAGIVVLAFYKPLEGIARENNWQARTRMNAYWYTSNLMRALLVSAVALVPYEGYRLYAHQEDLKQSILEIYSEANAMAKTIDLKEIDRASDDYEAQEAGRQEMDLSRAIAELEAKHDRSLEPQIELNKQSLQRLIFRHGDHRPKS